MSEFPELKRGRLSIQAMISGRDFVRKTVRRYLPRPEDVPRYGSWAASKLDAFKPCLEGRLKAGMWNAVALSLPVRESP